MPLLITLFKVIDKEPPIGSIWLRAALLAAWAVLVVRLTPGAMRVAGPLALLLAVAFLGEVHDPFAGSAIRVKAWAGYLAQYSAAAGVIALSPWLEWFWRQHAERTRASARGVD